MVWCEDVAKVLASEFNDMGYSIPSLPLPYTALYAASYVDPAFSNVLPILGAKTLADIGRDVLISHKKIVREVSARPSIMQQSPRVEVSTLRTCQSSYALLCACAAPPPHHHHHHHPPPPPFLSPPVVRLRPPAWSGLPSCRAVNS